MQRFSTPHYTGLQDIDNLPDEFMLEDHLGGFDENLDNTWLHSLNDYALDNNKRFKVWVIQVYDQSIQRKYPGIDFKLNTDIIENESPLMMLSGYTTHPALDYRNFVCSFNGTAHVSRKLLSACLKRFGYYDIRYCSKNFQCSIDEIDGHIRDYVGTNDVFYRKFIIGDDSESFFQTSNGFGHVRYDHSRNVHNLESQLTQSFLHIVSETMSTTYYPFVTEKFLYSVVTRGLFLTYGQPSWHDHLEQYYGFKKYSRLFDYRFDSIKNPIERLIELMTMISKFKNLSPADWMDLYNLEKDTIEYNYDHYFSKDYLKQLENFC